MTRTPGGAGPPGVGRAGLAGAAVAVLLAGAATAAPAPGPPVLPSTAGAAAAPTPGGEEAAGQEATGEDTTPAAREEPAPDVDYLLARARAAYDSLRTLRARFHQTIEMRVFEPPRRREGRGTWYQRKPGFFRMDFDEPEGDLVVSDGRHVWLFYPSTHPGQVVKSRLEGAGGQRGSEIVDLQGRVLEKARTDYEATYGGRETVEGHPSHLVVLEPRSRESPYTRIRVWIDARRWLVRRLVFEDRSETVRTVTLDEMETGVPVADSLFRFRPPEDVEVFEG